MFGKKVSNLFCIADVKRKMFVRWIDFLQLARVGFCARIRTKEAAAHVVINAKHCTSPVAEKFYGLASDKSGRSGDKNFLFRHDGILVASRQTRNRVLQYGAMRCVICSSTSLRRLFAHKAGHMAQCDFCGLVQLVPMPSSKEIGKLYHENFEHFTPYLEQLPVHRLYFRQKVKDIKKYIRSTGKNKIQLLDVGCAMGVLLEEAERSGIVACGIDISRDAVAYCRSRKLSVQSGTLQALNKKLQYGSFDVLTAFQVIEHERDPIGFIRRIHKLLKSDGLVVIATPDYGGFWRKIMGRRWFGFAHPEHVILFSEKSMRTLLAKAGFRDIHIHMDTPRPFPLSFALRRAADYFPFLAWICVSIAKLMDRTKIKNPINPWDDMIIFARK